MSLSRRHFVAASIAALATGCAETTSSLTRRPGPSWPSHARPTPTGAGRVVAPRRVQPQPAVLPPRPAVANSLRAIPRSRWAQADPITARLDGMGGINRITIHHEGWKPVYFDDYRTTAQRLERIRVSHLGRMKAGDIGYHFVVDRAGRVWEARPLQYQGAHAGGANNKNNIGIMALGNFDNHLPTGPQLSSLANAVRILRRQYNIHPSRVYTHQELSPTRCPGRNLQPRVASMRSSNVFV